MAMQSSLAAGHAAAAWRASAGTSLSSTAPARRPPDALQREARGAAAAPPAVRATGASGSAAACAAVCLAGAGVAVRQRRGRRRGGAASRHASWPDIQMPPLPETQPRREYQEGPEDWDEEDWDEETLFDQSEDGEELPGRAGEDIQDALGIDSGPTPTSSGLVPTTPADIELREAQLQKLKDALGKFQESRDARPTVEALQSWQWEDNVESRKAAGIVRKYSQKHKKLTFNLTNHPRRNKWGYMKELEKHLVGWKYSKEDDIYLASVNKLRQWEADTKARAERFMIDSGGNCSRGTLSNFLKGCFPKGFMERHFEQQLISPKLRNNEKDDDVVMLYLPQSPEQVSYAINRKAESVFRQLVKQGGTGNLHKLTGRFSIKKEQLLSFEGGGIFEVRGQTIVLAGGALNVAAAAADAGMVTTAKGSRIHPSRQEEVDEDEAAANLTNHGNVVDEEKADELMRRIEMYLVSEGDGVADSQQVFKALGLKPSIKLKRWVKRWLKMEGNDLWVDDEKLAYFRIRRSLRVLAMLLDETDGKLPLAKIVNFIRRPPEMPTLKGEEDGAPLLMEDLMQGDERFKPKVLQPPREDEEDDDSDFWDVDEEEQPGSLSAGRAGWQGGSPSSLAAVAAGNADLDTAMALSPQETTAITPEVMALARTKAMEEPVWIEAWVREHFLVEDNVVSLPDIPREVMQRRRTRQQKLDSLDPLEKLPMTPQEEEAKIMDVTEEIRLRYGRCSLQVLTAAFDVKHQWLRKCFDVTVNGDVIKKSVHRQTKEAVAISRFIRDSDGDYTDYDAMLDFGVSRTWLKAFFNVSPDGTLSLDDGSMDRVWNVPTMEPKAPNPFQYAKLKNVPRGYLRKSGGGNDGRKGIWNYRKRTPGWSAGAVMFDGNSRKLNRRASSNSRR